MSKKEKPKDHESCKHHYTEECDDLDLRFLNTKYLLVQSYWKEKSQADISQELGDQILTQFKASKLRSKENLLIEKEKVDKP